MISLDEVRSQKNDWLISLRKLIGKDIVDIEGYLTKELGVVLFKISEIILSDGTSMGVEGEHDFPYLCAYPTMPQKNFDAETFADLIKQGD